MSHLAKLQWQCRRGTKELDFLLERYLETCYLLAADAEKALFVQLLTFEDDELLGLLIGDFEISPGEMRRLVEKIRAFVVAGG
jgi:antitoxin CptB